MKSGKSDTSGQRLLTWEQLCQYVNKLKWEKPPPEPAEEKRKRKTTTIPNYAPDTVFWRIQHTEPHTALYDKAGKVEYTFVSKAFVVMKRGDAEHWQMFWRLRGYTMIECDRDWQPKEAVGEDEVAI
jgi:hypothetical protein